jgi:hypothetical protein
MKRKIYEKFLFQSNTLGSFNRAALYDNRVHMFSVHIVYCTRDHHEKSKNTKKVVLEVK